ncbi:putative cuticle protein [Operophtera brumata]|uniref:Putative cuticle protein n=1 Tax=Operophtera brumata TaxID=104452 RepID=A0A0L7KXC9_OPEBR|nr:putative cuticle protein [Operophtera brumata]
MFAKSNFIYEVISDITGKILKGSYIQTGVADPYTGDFKNQIEARAGNNVQGQYSLLESDGTRRTVDYAAGTGGFNAVVRKDPALIAAPVVSQPISRILPVGPIAPISRILPVGPIAPIAQPISRILPVGPIAPIAPGPISRILPVGPIAPIVPAPISRFLPGGPISPIVPIARFGSVGPIAKIGGIAAPFPYARYY